MGRAANRKQDKTRQKLILQQVLGVCILEVPIMSEAIRAYRHVAASPEFKEIERVRSKARHDEAQALKNAERCGAENERQKWQGVAEENEQLRQQIAALQANQKT